MIDDKPKLSVTVQNRCFTLAASPFNTVKFDLGVILVVGFLLLLTHARFIDSLVLQLLLLMTYGFGGMLWIMFRTYKVKRSISLNKKRIGDGTQ